MVLQWGYPDGEIDMRDIGYVARKFGTQGDSSRNVTIADPEWMPCELSEPTTRKIAIYSIGDSTGNHNWDHAGTLTVPSGEKWYIYKMNFYLFNDAGNEFVRIVINNTVMMDDIHVAKCLTNVGTTDLYNIELRRAIEVIEDEAIELWIRVTGSLIAGCVLTIEAWVEEV